MLAELAQDLLTKLQSIPALATSSGLDLVGDMPDPGAARVVPPAAWVIPKDWENFEDDAAILPAPAPNGRHEFVVGLYLPTTAQIATQLPLLNSVIDAIHGTVSPSGQRWYCRKYSRAATNPGVMVYAIVFAVSASF